MNKTNIKLAYQFGVQAFHDGLPCIPARDSEFLYILIKDCKVGEAIPYLDSWTKGWVHENLKEI